MRRLIVAILCIAFTASAAYAPQDVRGADVDELEAQIADRTKKIQELESEIARYEQELTVIGSEKKTLESEVSRLDLSRKKVGTDIAVTENRIGSVNLQLEELGLEITDKEARILQDADAVKQALRTVHRLGDLSLIEQLFATKDIADFWEEREALTRLQTSLRADIRELLDLKEALAEDQEEVTARKAQLVSLKVELSGQKAVLDATRKEQNNLLSATKSKESEYQRILNEKVEARKQFEAELQQFESQLTYALDPSSIPSSGSGTLKFPFSDEYMQKCKEREKTLKNIYCITQYFGDTAFSRGGAYNGKGHNGVDFVAQTGTKVLAALAGSVMATGNTDAVPRCYSYGKWVLVRHANGLSTLYAHLSVISVSEGQSVGTGDIIGFSGNTGYSTGPHLHFTVYASDGVQIKNLRDWYSQNGQSLTSPCAKGGAVIPVAATEAYLNPLQYL
jgi:murein DD-endopeptidase MepM/ murein hydrolase activator NlpD